MTSLSFKPFYVHMNRQTTKQDNSRLRHCPRGFTVLVSPADVPRTIQVQGTWCSSKDEFVKAAGRIQARDADKALVNPRDLPRLLEEMTTHCAIEETDFTYVLKYLL